MSRSRLSIIMLMVLALVVTACGETDPPGSPGDSADPGASLPATSDAPDASVAPDESEGAAPAPTDGRLADVQDRGTLICGVNGSLPGFSFLDSASGENTGFDADFCRAVAAAVLGEARPSRPARSTS
jgi:general L-amino acid transport system substrate-binding protein